MIFLRYSFCLSAAAVSLSRQRHDILDFTRDHVINRKICQKFGFDFHLRSPSSAFSGYGWSVDQLITWLLATPCGRDPTRANQLSTVELKLLAFSLASTMSLPRCKLSTLYQHHCLPLKFRQVVSRRGHKQRDLKVMFIDVPSSQQTDSR